MVSGVGSSYSHLFISVPFSFLWHEAVFIYIIRLSSLCIHLYLLLSAFTCHIELGLPIPISFSITAFMYVALSSSYNLCLLHSCFSPALSLKYLPRCCSLNLVYVFYWSTPLQSYLDFLSLNFFQGPCCTTTCELKFGDKCRDDNGCRDASFCDGRGPQCPPSVNKPNKTICNEEFVCFMGVSRDIIISPEWGIIEDLLRFITKL